MFQDAEVTDTNKKQDGISFTTDDLVLLIGEKVVENKFQTRILELQKKKIIDLEGQLLKFQSQKISLDQSVNDLQVHITDLETQISKLQSSRQEYAISLENKVHEVAIERDGLKKEIEELKQKNESSVNIIQKRKKKVDVT